MVVIISDLHFQDHINDDLLDTNGDSITIARSMQVSPDAFKLFFFEVLAAAEQNIGKSHDKEIVLILAGDIFELNRSVLWFKNDARPYLEHTKWEETALEIMDAIKDSNPDTFECFSEFANQVNKKGYRLDVQYIPGNHDRLIHRSAKLREKAREVLRIPDISFQYYYESTRYGLLVRHGHEYDQINFAGKVPENIIDRLSEEDCARPALGEYLTIDIAARLAYLFRNKHKDEILNGEQDKLHRKIYNILLEFDDVRPISSLFKFVEFRTGSLYPTTINLIQPLLNEIAKEAGNSKFLKSEIKRLKGPIRSFFLSFITPEKILHLLKNATDEDAYQFAVRERVLKDSDPRDIRYIVAGHTHSPGMHPLQVLSDHRQQFFFDSGTWRKVHHQCKFKNNTFPYVRFSETKALTYLIFYKIDEDTDPKSNGKKYSFDYWSGYTKKTL